MTVTDCRLISLPRLDDARGSLSFVESGNHIPFEIKRVYYLYHVPLGVERGAHAHKQLEQLIIAISGSFEIELDDGHEKARFYMNSPDQGLYISRMNWRSLSNFSDDAVCMVLASEPYSEDDYFRNYEEFLAAVTENRTNG